MKKPGMIITGATGFLGKRLVERLRDKYEIFGIARRSPQEAGLPEGPGLHWFQVDIAYFKPLWQVFNKIQQMADIDILLHLAAYYDFSGDNHPEYMRTNIIGTHNVLELSVPLNLKRFFYTSSVAACPFPELGNVVTEKSPPTAPVPYAQSKRKGEEMIHKYQDRIPGCILRLAAVFSNWCEYEPLANFILTWHSNQWNSHVLGGKGDSAVPYIHARDLLLFYLRVIEMHEELEPGEILQASPNGSTTHLELYQEVTRCYFGQPRFALHVPKLLARPGIIMREQLGRLTGDMPFERAWMADYIDIKLEVDATHTHRRLNWTPREELSILNSIPTVIKYMRDEPELWNLRSYLAKENRKQSLLRHKNENYLTGQYHGNYKQQDSW